MNLSTLSEYLQSTIFEKVMTSSILSIQKKYSQRTLRQFLTVVILSISISPGASAFPTLAEELEKNKEDLKKCERELEASQSEMDELKARKKFFDDKYRFAEDGGPENIVQELIKLDLAPIKTEIFGLKEKMNRIRGCIRAIKRVRQHLHDEAQL